MDNLNDTTLVPDILKGLFQEWLQKYSTENKPIVQIREDSPSEPGYTLGPVVSIIVSHEYEITALLGECRFYMAPVKAVTTGERRKRLDEGHKRQTWAPSGEDILAPSSHTAWALQCSILHLGRIDERSIHQLNGEEATFTTKRQLLTQIFKDGFDWACQSALRKPNLIETTRHFTGFYTALSRQSLDRVQTDIRNNESHLHDLSRQYNQTITTLARQRESERLLKLAVNEKCDRTQSAVERISRQLQHLVGDRFRSITISNEELVAIHTDVQIEDPNSGDTSDLGDIRCRIELTGKELIRFEACGNNEWRGDYFHPHISTQGSPCLGNIGEDVNKLLAQREWGTLLLLLDEFLMSYNPSDPYTEWFSEGQDEHEDCYESGDNDCRDCRDEHCPYWEGRWIRCADGMPESECLECSYRDCPYFEDAVNDCRNNGGPYECLQCQRDWCQFSLEDENDCYERNEPECGDCSHRSDCSAWVDEDEEDDEQDDNNDGNETETDGPDTEGAVVG